MVAGYLLSSAQRLLSALTEGGLYKGGVQFWHLFPVEDTLHHYYYHIHHSGDWGVQVTMFNVDWFRNMEHRHSHFPWIRTWLAQFHNKNWSHREEPVWTCCVECHHSTTWNQLVFTTIAPSPFPVSVSCVPYGIEVASFMSLIELIMHLGDSCLDNLLEPGMCAKNIVLGCFSSVTMTLSAKSNRPQAWLSAICPSLVQLGPFLKTSTCFPSRTLALSLLIYT